MDYFQRNKAGGNSGKKYGRKGGSGGSFSFGGRDSAKPIMHPAICSECDQECEVPFKPSGDKPVFCRNCFKSREAASPREFAGKDFGKRSFQKLGAAGGGSGMTKEQFEILNLKLDKILNKLDSVPPIRS